VQGCSINTNSICNVFDNTINDLLRTEKVGVVVVNTPVTINIYIEVRLFEEWAINEPFA
jgi:hypothetical protein